jgi:hypothetical protein
MCCLRRSELGCCQVKIRKQSVVCDICVAEAAEKEGYGGRDLYLPTGIGGDLRYAYTVI